MGVSQKGMRDWIAQRVSAILMTFYIIFLSGYFLTHDNIQFTDWQDLFSCVWMQIATILVLLGLVWHAWIGIWTILTDYVKCSVARLTLELLTALSLAAFFFWGISIFWRL